MSQRNRYFIWRGIADVDEQVSQLIKISKEYESDLTRVTDGFAVVFVTEEEILSLLPLSEDGQILISKEGMVLNGRKVAGEFLIGIDAPIALAEYSGRRNVQPGPASFNRFRVENLIHADSIREFAAPGNRTVNVVIVDGGLDECYLKSIGYLGNVETIPGLPGSKTRPHVQESNRHANAVSRVAFSRLHLMLILSTHRSCPTASSTRNFTPQASLN